MILRATGTALILFLVWAMVVRYIPANLDSSQTLWGENVIHAQDYLYAEIAPTDLTIVGSSLSEKLLLKEINGRRVRNLGFSGQGVNDGLNVIMAADQLPGFVLVEMNVIMQAENAQFRDVVLHPAANLARQHLPLLRQRYQPVGVLKGLLLGKSTAGEARDSLRDRPVNQLSLDQKIKDYSSPVDRDALMHILKDLSKRLKELQDQGVQVLFYELPVHPELCRSPKAVAIREGFRSVFPPTEFTYIPQPECPDYATTDGHHLGERSNASYSALLKRQVGRIIQ